MRTQRMNTNTKREQPPPTMSTDRTAPCTLMHPLSTKKSYIFILKPMKEISIFDFCRSLISPAISFTKVQNLLKFQQLIINLCFMLSLSLYLSRVYQGPCCRVILAFCPPPLILLLLPT